jgi:hypothetical protein
MADFRTQLELTSELEQGRLSSVKSDTVELQRWIVREVESSANVLSENSPPAHAPVRITDFLPKLESGNLIIDTSVRIQTF